MMTIESRYLGALRSSAVHVRSSREILTDAPPDNNGKGEAFSPTDLVAASLGCCMATVMGIYCRNQGILLDGLTWDTEKIMAANPRKVSTVRIHFHWPQPQGSDQQRERMKEIALSCPVALSLHPDLRQEIYFDF